MSLSPQVSSNSAQDSVTQTTLSPISLLSEDILIEIFSELSSPQNRAIHPLFLACQTCRDWRRILLSTPVLWTQPRILAPLLVWCAMYETDQPRQAWLKLSKALRTRLQVWIARSKGLPLSITLRINDFLSEEQSAMIPEWVKAMAFEHHMSMINHVCDTASRWRSINLEVDFATSCRDEGLARLRALKARDVPLLEQIHAFTLGPYPAIDRIDDHPVQAGIFRGPSVQLLRLPTMAFQWDALHINWETLTELRCKYFLSPGPNGCSVPSGPCAMLSLLGACKKLERCTLDASYMSLSPPGRSPPMVEMSNLRELILEAHYLPPSATFADSLSLPSLSDLRFAGWNLGLPGLTHWLERFGGQLTTVGFELPSLHLSSAEAGGLLNLIPNVEKLMLVEPSPLDKFRLEIVAVGTSLPTVLDTLTIKGTTEDSGLPRSEVFCPKLTRLEVGFHLDNEFPESQMLSFVKSRGDRLSRRLGIAKLHTVCCWSMARLDYEGDLKETYRRMGLDEINLDFRFAYCIRGAYGGPPDFMYL